jgi:hypothetical protein
LIIAFALFHLLGSLSASLTTFVLGLLGDAFDAVDNPQLYGTIMGSFVVAFYVTCSPLFMWAGREYNNKMTAATDDN